jgi:hypothetical protein
MHNLFQYEPFKTGVYLNYTQNYFLRYWPLEDLPNMQQFIAHLTENTLCLQYKFQNVIDV